MSLVVKPPYVLIFPSGYVAMLTKSLCIAQDFLTAIWLCWSSEQEQFRGLHWSKWWERHRPDASFPQAMTVIVLATICLLACVFYLFVLFQWTRDTKRKTTTRVAVDDAAGETGEEKRPQIVGPKRTNEKHDRFMERSHLASSTRGLSHSCGPGCNECERVVYERVVNLMKPRKRS